MRILNLQWRLFASFGFPKIIIRFAGLAKAGEVDLDVQILVASETCWIGRNKLGCVVSSERSMENAPTSAMPKRGRSACREASGAVESGRRSVPKKRLKIPGAS